MDKKEINYFGFVMIILFSMGNDISAEENPVISSLRTAFNNFCPSLLKGDVTKKEGTKLVKNFKACTKEIQSHCEKNQETKECKSLGQQGLAFLGIFEKMDDNQLEKSLHPIIKHKVFEHKKIDHIEVAHKDFQHKSINHKEIKHKEVAHKEVEHVKVEHKKVEHKEVQHKVFN